MSDVVANSIQALLREREQLDQAIAALQKLQSLQASTEFHINGSRRGRKFMGTVERAEVSERMKRYWPEQRKAKGAA